MNKVIWAFMLLSSLILTSCDSSYKVKDGKVYHVRFNEGSGYHLDLLPVADAQTFAELEDDFGHDAKHAWYQKDMLEGADGASFHTLGRGYAADDSLVFRTRYLIEGADAATFKVHTSCFAEDCNDYYWAGQPLHVADKASFVLMGSAEDANTHWAKDTLYVYFLEVNHDSNGPRMKIADYDSFHPIEGDFGCFAADKYQVYLADTIVVGADPATFQEVDYRQGKDKNRTYNLQ